MSPALAKRLRLLASSSSVVVLLAVVAGGWFYGKIRASLPRLDGTTALPGLSAPVMVTRDALGVPTVRGASRVDVARALGYLHAQDRFFQMDTLRRRGAGELAELFGKVALRVDRATRVHGFRQLAQVVISHAAPEDRALVEAYTTGVNTGLAALGARPFEYLVLRTAPRPWLPEDTVLVSCAMVLDLEDSTGSYERMLALVRDKLGSAPLAFFAPVVTPNDAALDGTTAPAAPMPTDRQLDLRKSSASTSGHRAPTVAGSRANLPDGGLAPANEDYLASGGRPPAAAELSPGSNSLALAGGRTASGAALLANDMHLELRVPNTWYRASLMWPDHQVTGVTLPGTPFLVAGSNGHVAWGLTAANADRSDLVVVPVSSADSALYVSDGKLVEFETRRAKILVKGGAPVESETQWTVWGPVIGADEKTRPLALHWAAHDPAAFNLILGHLDSARNVDEAVAIAHRAGLTPVNFLVADTDGHIAWTIAGRLPQRFGHSGRLPVPWVYGDRGWRGLLPPDDMPVIKAGSDGQLWTANNRVVGGTALTALGDGGYEPAARAAQIRDDMAQLAKATPRDLLAIQLDDRALFLARWQSRLLATLTPKVVAQKESRSKLRALVEKWEGHASIDSVSYRLVRAWRTAVANLVFAPLFAPCVDEDKAFNWRRLQYEGALWTMLREKPAHLLNPRFATWNDLLVAAADETIADLDRQGVLPVQATWGRHNTARIRHPLGAVLPAWLAGWLNLPADQLPGDSYMPRVQGPAFGASERFVVSPGRETEGIFHMPGGQSGHPLSPFYRAGHAAWVRGEPAPFLPGKTEHTLEFRP